MKRKQQMRALNRLMLNHAKMYSPKTVKKRAQLGHLPFGGTSKTLFILNNVSSTRKQEDLEK
jgi:hypothetical protein